MNREMLKEAFMAALEQLGDLREMSGAGGSLIIDDTATYAVEAHSIVANSATVINAITGVNGNDGAVNFAAAPYNWVTLPAGTFMKVPKGYRILSIDLTSGSLSVYNY